MKISHDEETGENGMIFCAAKDLKDGEICLRLKETREAVPGRQQLPVYYFDICLPDGTRIGNCDLRIGHNEKSAISGNIGYGIYPAFRGHHYGARACVLLLQLAKEHGMDYLLVTCDPANRASSRTCELAGGIRTGVKDVPRDHELYAGGKRQVVIYRFDL